jgi:hypothetical protein
MTVLLGRSPRDVPLKVRTNFTAPEAPRFAAFIAERTEVQPLQSMR